MWIKSSDPLTYLSVIHILTFVQVKDRLFIQEVRFPIFYLNKITTHEVEIYTLILASLLHIVIYPAIYQFGKSFIEKSGPWPRNHFLIHFECLH